MQSARFPREDETYYDDGMTPKALNIRRSQLQEIVPSPTRRYKSQSESTEGQDPTPLGPLRIMNPDVDHDYHNHRRAAIYVPSPAQQALQRVVTPQLSDSTRSSRSRLSSLGSEILNTVKRHKPKRKASTVSAKQKSANNPLRAPPGAMSDTESVSVGGLSRSVSLNSNKSSIAGPQTAPMSVVAPFAHAEPVQISPLDLLTPGGVACAELHLQSFTAVYSPDEHHYSPAVTVWAVATVTCIKYDNGTLVNYNDGTGFSMNRAQLALRSHGQIANLRLGISPPETFDVIAVLGRLQHRQVLLGSTWSVIFKLRSVNKISMPPKPAVREDGCQSIDPFPTAGTIWAADPIHRIPLKTENDRLMEEVEKMLKPEEEIVANVEYNHNLFPTTTTMHESDSCPINAITESERRHRQFYEQRGQPWRQQRGTSILTTNIDLDRDLQMANAICDILGEGVGAKWPKNSKSSVRYTTIPPADALQLLYDFREAAGSTLPQDVTEEMDRLKEAYKQVRKERQEGSFTRKSFKAVVEMGRIARRAIPTSSTFSGRYGYHVPSLNGSHYTPENSVTLLADSAQQPLGNDFTLKDITNDISRRRGVARFIDTLPIVGRRKNARTDTAAQQTDLEKGVREDDQEIKAIWKKVRIISGASSTISDDMERINESNLGGPPWM